MSYFSKPLSGLGATSSCGTGQTYYPSVSFAGKTQGMCMTPQQVQECKSKGSYAGQPCKINETSASSGVVSSILSVLTKPATFTQPQAPVVAPRPASGGLSTTAIVLAGGAVVAAILLSRR